MDRAPRQFAQRVGGGIALGFFLAAAGSAFADNASAVRRGAIGPNWLEITVRNTAENMPNPGDEAGPIYDFHVDISTKSGRPAVTFTGEHGSYRNGWQPRGNFTGRAQAVFDTIMNPVLAGQMMRFILQVTCGAGVIHVGAEGKYLDREGSEHGKINENVLIEIGAAMALYGKKVVLLVEKGVTLPSNL